MNQDRLDRLESMQSGIARKVLACVPLQEAWTARQIVSKLARNGHNPHMRIVEGCLSSLVESGLCIENKKGFFRRASGHVKKEPEMIKTEVTPRLISVPAQSESKPNPDAFTRLAQLVDELRELVGEIETAALDALKLIEAKNQEMKELDALKAVLKKISQ